MGSPISLTPPARARRWLALVLALPCLASAQVDAGPTSAERLKAAFVYKFTLLVAWPDSAFARANAPLSLCVLGDDPFAGELAPALEGRSSGQHPFELRWLERGDQASACHVLYVGRGRVGELEAALAAAAGAPMLTIGENEELLDRGGVIWLDVAGGHIRFEIARGAAGRAGLDISSKLLQVARAVHD